MFLHCRRYIQGRVRLMIQPHLREHRGSPSGASILIRNL
jgi:hypothetical protein